MERARRFLPEPLTVLHNLVDQLQGFSSRPDIGIETGLIERMIRFYTGDPIVKVAVTSTFFGDQHGIPNISDATSCIIHVAGNDIFYTVDGTSPNPAGDSLIQAGSIVTLTGVKTITGFQFISTAGNSATLFITYYT